MSLEDLPNQQSNTFVFLTELQHLTIIGDFQSSFVDETYDEPYSAEKSFKAFNANQPQKSTLLAKSINLLNRAKIQT